MNKQHISETMPINALLAVSGGFMDAYSYICRGEVFANAQTGNILLLGVNLAEKNWNTAFMYFMPIAGFCIGIIMAELMRQRHSKDSKFLHWRQSVLLYEIFYLLPVCFLPQEYNLLANSLTSLVCGIQVQSFRKLNGNNIATTMCIGNLRSATENLCTYLHLHDKTYLKKAVLYYAVILYFVIGAIIGNFMIAYLNEHAILFSVFILLLTFAALFFKHPNNNTHTSQ